MAPKVSKRKVLDERGQIAERLKNARTDLELTQMQLAEKTGLGRSTIMHYENAKAAPGAMELLKLARTLEISPNYILTGKHRFRKNVEGDISFDTADQTRNAIRVTLCLAALEPGIRDSFYNLLLTMVKERVGERDFSKLMAVMDAMAPTVEEMVPDIESIAEKHLGAAMQAKLEKAAKEAGKK